MTDSNIVLKLQRTEKCTCLAKASKDGVGVVIIEWRGSLLVSRLGEQSQSLLKGCSRADLDKTIVNTREPEKAGYGAHRHSLLLCAH